MPDYIRTTLVAAETPTDATPDPEVHAPRRGRPRRIPEAGEMPTPPRKRAKRQVPTPGIDTAALHYVIGLAARERISIAVLHERVCAAVAAIDLLRDPVHTE